MGNIILSINRNVFKLIHVKIKTKLEAFKQLNK